VRLEDREQREEDTTGSGLVGHDKALVFILSVLETFRQLGNHLISA